MNILGCENLHGRESRARSTAINVAKTLLQIVLFWGFFLALVPSLILLLERSLGLPNFASPIWRAVGLSLFAGFSFLGLWCASIFATIGRGTPLPLDTTTRLVIIGPYRFIRNPMALAGIAQGFSAGLILGSPSTLAYAILGGLAWQYLARPWEEKDLAQRFGEPYRSYRERVPCWVPTFKPYPRSIEGHSESADEGA